MILQNILRYMRKKEEGRDREARRRMSEQEEPPRNHPVWSSDFTARTAEGQKGRVTYPSEPAQHISRV